MPKLKKPRRKASFLRGKHKKTKKKKKIRPQKKVQPLKKKKEKRKIRKKRKRVIKLGRPKKVFTPEKFQELVKKGKERVLLRILKFFIIFRK